MKEFNFTFPCSIGEKVWCLVPNRNEVRNEKVICLDIIEDNIFVRTDLSLGQIAEHISKMKSSPQKKKRKKNLKGG